VSDYETVRPSTPPPERYDEMRALTRTGMALMALRRRTAALGVGSVLRRAIPAGTRVIYIDIGMHKQARQLCYVKAEFGDRLDLRTIGFEAHPTYFREAVAAVRPGSKDTLVNAAVVGPGQGASVRLNLDGREGLGDSIVRAGIGQGIDVPAVRLSDIIRSRGIDRSEDVVLLRMNIEGAELYVLEDLEQAGLLGRIDGYYGYWDDPAKIGGDVAQRFEAVMARTGIARFPFNDRDFRNALRLAAVKYDLTTTIIAALEGRADRPAQAGRGPKIVPTPPAS